MADTSLRSFGSAALCNVDSWTGDAIHVRCFDAAGALADSPYAVRFAP